MVRLLWILLLAIPLAGFSFLTVATVWLVFDRRAPFATLLLALLSGAIVYYLGMLVAQAFQKHGGELQDTLPLSQERPWPAGEKNPSALHYVLLALFGPLAIRSSWDKALLKKAPISDLGVRQRNRMALWLMLSVWAVILSGVAGFIFEWNGQLVGLIGLAVLITLTIGSVLAIIWFALKKKSHQ